jgi:hypothetical protein
LTKNEQETSISFVVPAKCLVKRKLECVCIEEDQEDEQNALHGSEDTVQALDSLGRGGGFV